MACVLSDCCLCFVGGLPCSRTPPWFHCSRRPPCFRVYRPPHAHYFRKPPCCRVGNSCTYLQLQCSAKWKNHRPGGEKKSWGCCMMNECWWEVAGSNRSKSRAYTPYTESKLVFCSKSMRACSAQNFSHWPHGNPESNNGQLNVLQVRSAA